MSLVLMISTMPVRTPLGQACCDALGDMPVCVHHQGVRRREQDEARVGVVVPFEDKHPEKPGLEALSGLVAADMERVNATILSRTGSEVAMITEAANHLISSGGKRRA